METQTAFQHVQKFHLLEHGDSREREIWPIVSDQLSNYEQFWQSVIVLLTNRVEASKRGTNEWIRLRSGLPRPYEDLAMSNYSAFYYAASVIEQMKDNETRISSGKHPRTELVFFYLEMCIENAKRLQRTGRALLGTWGINCNLPKHRISTIRLLVRTEMRLRMIPFLAGRRLMDGSCFLRTARYQKHAKRMTS